MFPKPKARKAKDRRREDAVTYASLRFTFLSRHRYCQARIACDQTATDPWGNPKVYRALATEVHHKRGRGPHYLDTRTWLAVCRACHEHIGAFPQEAYDKGWSERRNDADQGTGSEFGTAADD